MATTARQRSTATVSAQIAVNSTERRERCRCPGPFVSPRWNRLFILLAIICVATLLRQLVPAQLIVQPTRWIRSDGIEQNFPQETIECPRWDGSPSRPGTIREPLGAWKPDRRLGPPVYLYAVVASTTEALATLSHFIQYYIHDLGIPASHTLVTIQAPIEHHVILQEIAKLLDQNKIHYDLWIGTFSSATKAWHREQAADKALDPNDWLVVADVDEFHQFPKSETGSHANVYDSFLHGIETREGANYISSSWEDRISSDGTLAHVKADTPSLEEQFPMRCSMTEWTVPASGFWHFLLPKAENKKIAAHKVGLRIHRSAHKVAWRALWRWLSGIYAKPHAASIQLVSRHYKWVAGLAPYLDRRVKTYDTCGMLWSYESASINAHLEEHGGKICLKCGELACARAEPKPKTRIAVVTSVWDEHVDGVSITMNRVARFLTKSSDLECLVVTPHDPNVKTPIVDMSDVTKLSSSSLPIFALVGRNDYVVGLPLGSSHKQALDAYDPDVYHLVSPDALGYSAQRYAKQTGKCAVCSYHTQLDRYVRFYATKHGFLDKFKPRILIQNLFADFYAGCDVVAVPNHAIADKLVAKMRIPREKIGFFPRGVNTTQYNPNRRNTTWRASVGCDTSKKKNQDDNVVVLWAARLVKEKGATLFADSLAHFFKKAPKEIADRIRVVVVGDGPEREAMMNALPKSHTTFLLHLSGVQLWTAYASSDIYFFPSHTEAFPNTLLEAQASGLAVLAPAYSVNRDLVPQNAGYLVDEHAGPTDFARALLDLVQNEDRRKQIATEAIKVARARTWTAAFSSLTDCYNRCLKLKPTSSSRKFIPSHPASSNISLPTRRRTSLRPRFQNTTPEKSAEGR